MFYQTTQAKVNKTVAPLNALPGRTLLQQNSSTSSIWRQGVGGLNTSGSKR
jgi:hypothetical protein